jgi:hypothetical protein
MRITQLMAIGRKIEEEVMVVITLKIFPRIFQEYSITLKIFPRIFQEYSIHKHEKKPPSAAHHFIPSIARENHNNCKREMNCSKNSENFGEVSFSTRESYVQMKYSLSLFIQNVLKYVYT